MFPGLSQGLIRKDLHCFSLCQVTNNFTFTLSMDLFKMCWQLVWPVHFMSISLSDWTRPGVQIGVPDYKSAILAPSIYRFSSAHMQRNTGSSQWKTKQGKCQFTPLTFYRDKRSLNVFADIDGRQKCLIRPYLEWHRKSRTHSNLGIGCVLFAFSFCLTFA